MNIYCLKMESNMSGMNKFTSWFGAAEGKSTKQTSKTNSSWQSADASARPSMYSLLLLNTDNISDAVTKTILEKFFHISPSSSTELLNKENCLLESGLGKFTKDLAETKSGQIMDYSKRQNLSLKCVVHKISN
jgi:ATP-dependent Clp protease adaptor protein ClpS